MGTLDPTKDVNLFTKREFHLHRSKLSAVDAAGNLSGAGFGKTAGVPGEGYRKAVIDCNMDTGSATSVVYEVLYWSDDKQAFVSASPSDTFTLTTGNGQFQVEHGGRIFLVAIRTITGGATPVINISARGSWPDNSEGA